MIHLPDPSHHHPIEMPLMRSDEAWMALALKEAAHAYEQGEVPVGAVIVSQEGKLLGKAHNLRETLRDPTAHAEMLAITQAANALDSWRLVGTTLYVTLEPCPMCAGALVNARVSRLVYGAADPKAGACGSLLDIVRDERLNHRIPTTTGVLAEPSGELLRAFFRERRRSGTSATTTEEGGEVVVG